MLRCGKWYFSLCKRASYKYSRKQNRILRQRPQFVACDLRGKFEGGEANCCHIAAERKTAVSRRRVRGLSLNITKIFLISLRKICEELHEQRIFFL